MEGLQYVHGCWAVDNYGDDVWAQGDYWTVACLVNQFAEASQGSWRPSPKTIYMHISRGRFPVLRVKGTTGILIDPKIGEFLVRHVEPLKTWPTVRIVDGEIQMLYEPYGSRILTAHHVAETGRLHDIPVGVPVALTRPINPRDQGVDGQ